jgi:hypothetical protein
MKKLLSFIMIAIIASTGIFALDVSYVTNGSGSGTDATPNLPKIFLQVEQDEVPTALVQLKYNGSEYEETILTDTNWEIGEATSNPYATEEFTLVFTTGVVSAGTSENSNDYTVVITPGAFMQSGTPAYTDTSATTELVPEATEVVATDGVSYTYTSGTGILTATKTFSANTYIDTEAVLARFTLEWDSVSYATYLNASGTYVSTTTVNISAS